MTIFQAIVLSILEGLTEFLPISSTGHLILAQKYLAITTTEFSKSFDIIIQFAAILAVVWYFRQKLLSSYKIWSQTIIAFIPTGLIGFLLYKIIRHFLLENPLVTAYSLLLGGLALLLVDRLEKINSGQKKITELSPKQLLGIGLFQSLSIVPGVSRSAASIVGGLISGLSRLQAVEFSFILAIPTMFAATAYDLLKSGLHFSSSEYLILFIGCLFAFLSSLLAVKFFLNFIKKHNFTVFAIYRILLALTVLISLK
jgi:undecaprenyl-diphosphatase